MDDAAHGLLDQIEQAGGFFDAGTRLGADMHQDLPEIDRREKVLAQKRPEAERQRHEGDETSDHNGRAFDGERQQRSVTATHDINTRSNPS